MFDGVYQVSTINAVPSDLSLFMITSLPLFSSSLFSVTSHQPLAMMVMTWVFTNFPRYVKYVSLLFSMPNAVYYLIDHGTRCRVGYQPLQWSQYECLDRLGLLRCFRWGSPGVVIHSEPASTLSFIRSSKSFSPGPLLSNFSRLVSYSCIWQRSLPLLFGLFLAMPAAHRLSFACTAVYSKGLEVRLRPR